MRPAISGIRLFAPRGGRRGLVGDDPVHVESAQVGPGLRVVDGPDLDQKMVGVGFLDVFGGDEIVPDQDPIGDVRQGFRIGRRRER